MRRFSLVSLIMPIGISLLGLTEFMPLVTHAAFFGPLIPPACNCDPDGGFTAILGVTSSAPAWGCILTTFQNAITLGVSLATVIITVFIAWAGFTYMTSGDSAEKRSLANKRIMNAVIGLVIVLASYLIVDSLMKVLYDPSTAKFGPWNSILAGDGQADCLAPVANPAALPGIGVGSNPNSATAPNSSQTTTVPATGGTGACSASNIQSAASSEGVAISSSDASTLACLAKYESSCGAVNKNYNWGNGSSAYGPFQVTLQGNASYFNNAACEKAVGATGPLNCQAGFSAGNPIPGSTIAATCEQAAANLGCSAAAASELYDAKGISQWTADSNTTSQGSCGS